jgi:hypothetical protein
MSSIPTQKTIEQMETWEILREAIDRGESEEVAKILRRKGVSCSGPQVRSWRNDTDVDDGKIADPIGRRNPLDEIIDVINAIGARKPGAAAMIAKRIEIEAAKVEADHGKEELLKDVETIKKAREKAKEFLSITEVFGDG